jgi:uncharacterized protein YjbJ (UPF0337 family)
MVRSLSHAVAGVAIRNPGIRRRVSPASGDSPRGHCRQPSKESQMNWNQVEGNWKQLKGKVQTQWGKLTGDDLDVINGGRQQLVGKIQERYGKAQEDAEREVDDWMNKLN